MKKMIAIAAAAGILLSSAFNPAAAAAKEGKHQPHGHSIDKKTGLERALERVKNKTARAAIIRALERLAEARGESFEDWKDGWDPNSPDQQQTDQEIVAKDKAAAAIDFGGQDTVSSVTVPFDKLPDRGAAGSVITWRSSNTAIISNDGKTVNRPAVGTGDARVVMTATLKYGSATASKSFTLTVIAQMNDADKVTADKSVLAIGFSQGDTASSVTRPLTLPVTGTYGSSIKWISGSPSLISDDGKTVNRPAAGSGDAKVVLTAIITSNGSSDIKTFTITVKQQMTDAQALAAAKAALTIGFQPGDSLQSVTHPITLPTTGLEGTSVSWMSGNPAVVSNDGKTVNRPANGSGDATVGLTAIISKNGYTDIKTFSIIVKQQLTDSQKVAADKAALSIGFSDTDTAASVTGPLTLPTVGWNGSTIVWISGNEAIISSDGKTVVRPTGTSDVHVALVAIIVSGSASDTKSFSVTVKHR